MNQALLAGLTYPRNLFYLCQQQIQARCRSRAEDFMTSLHERFSGLFIPHVSPFESSGALDLESLAPTNEILFVSPRSGRPGFLRPHR